MDEKEEINYMFEFLYQHVGHDIHCVTYGEGNVTIECWDCNEVLYSVDKYDI